MAEDAKAPKLVVHREGPVKITRATIEKAWRRRAAGHRLMIGDAECRGLALVVNPTGMVWRFDYKPRGLDPVTGKRFNSRSVTIGTPAKFSPEDARAEASRHKSDVQNGADPADAKRQAIAAAAERRARTVDRLLEDYAKARPAQRKLRGGGGTASAAHVANEIAYLRAAVAAMGVADRPVEEIGRRQIESMLNAAASMVASAKHRFGALSRFLDWCQWQGFIPVNPCTHVPKDRRPRAPDARQHRIPLADLAAIWRAAGDAPGLSDVQRDFVRFLLAVPCRRGEAATMDWAHLDLQAGIWQQPGALTKNGDTHRFLLPALALEMLRKRHEDAGKPAAGLVFPSPRAGKPLSTFSDLREMLGAAVPGDWRLHDIRRSFASTLAENGIAEPVADAVLNHRQSATRGGVRGVYQVAPRWPEQMRAMQLWGEMLAAAIEGRDPPAENVVALRRA